MNKRGFTLIELFLVIAIISLILMLTLPALMTVRRQALIVGCQNNMKQISAFVEIYRLKYEGAMPYVFYASGGVLDPEHRGDLETADSGLTEIVENNVGILKCPADTGYDGVDYELTEQGVSCYACFGRSYTCNNSLSTDPPADYVPGQPILFDVIKRGDLVIMVSDFSSVWHGAAASGKKGVKYFLNFLYFDGHIQGKEFESDEEAKVFRSESSRWWVE